MATDRHTDRQTDRQTDRRPDRQTDRQTDTQADTQTTCQKYLFWIQWPSKREHSSKSGSRFFGQMQYFLYTSYSRESKNINITQKCEDDKVKRVVHLRGGSSFLEIVFVVESFFFPWPRSS